MNKHKKNDKHAILRRPMLPVLAFVVAAAALAVAAILSVSAVYERDRLNTLSDQEVQHTIENSYWTNRIIFCYDNDIHPCTLDTIAAWNKAHPNNTFSVVPPSS